MHKYCRATAIKTALFIALVVGAATSQAHGEGRPSAATPLVNMIFQCDILTSGTTAFPTPGNPGTASGRPCFYRLIARRCEVIASTPAIARICRTETLMEFKLDPGVKKTVPNLPADFQYCVADGATPSVADCVAHPVNH